MVGLRSYLSCSAVALHAIYFSTASARPVEERSALNIFDDVLLFDSPATIASQPKVEVSAYAYLRQINLSWSALETLVSGLFDGIDLSSFANGAENAVDRLSLFVSIPLPDKTISVNIDSCGEVTLQNTSDDVEGISVTNVTCSQSLVASTGSPLNATVDLGDRGMTAKVFPSPTDGFGVISDVDDTVKISDVLDRIKLVENTFLADPLPVAGMPALYSTLQTKLSNPFFAYVSGSPFQLFPFIDSFVENNYPDGPKYLRNITVFDLPNLYESLTDRNGTYDHKLNTIDRIVGIYPMKRFMLIGDSTEMDPETYAEVYRRHPQNVQCIWIRLVTGANNNATRFTSDWANIPSSKTRTFVDSDMASMQNLDVANGQC